MSPPCPVCGRESAGPPDASGPCARCAGAIDVTRALGILESPSPSEGPSWAGRAGRFPAVVPAPQPPPAEAPAPEPRERRSLTWVRRVILVAAALALVAVGAALGALVQFLLGR
jgi:hypothetical protein